MSLTLKVTDWELSVCKLAAAPSSSIFDDSVFCALVRTPEELSLVCETRLTAHISASREEKNWRCFKVEGVLDFALTGILAGISEALAAANISIFALSSFDTDYIMVKAARLDDAVAALREAGYKIER